MAEKTPLLKNLIVIQLLAIAAAVGALGLAFVVASKSIYLKEVANIRQKVQDALNENQERWRTWQQLELNDALKEDTESFRRTYPLAILDVRHAAQIKLPLSAEELVLPADLSESSKGPADLDSRYVVYVRLDTHRIRQGQLPFRSGFMLLGGAGVLFIAIILFSARYVQRNIHRPIRELNESFGQLRERNEFSVGHVQAKGEIRQFISAVERMYAEVKEHEKKQALVAVASQVAHDIKSPLAALKIGLTDLPQLPEDKRILLRTAASRIADIANNLLERGRERMVKSDMSSDQTILTSQEPIRTELLSSTIDALISEKQWEYRSRRGLTIKFVSGHEAPQDIFVDVQPSEFKRVLSNLINNAVEAVTERVTGGTVSIHLDRDAGYVTLRVKDNGNGIPNDVLPRLMARGSSFGKTGGSGLGLFHARTCAGHWGGSLSIESKERVGTIVSLRLPSSPAPSWFASCLRLPACCTVIALDDDSSVHQIWKERFAKIQTAIGLACRIKLHHFTNSDEFAAWHSCTNQANDADGSNDRFYLFDYELIGSPESGLKLIERLDLAEKSVLVTNRFEEETLRTRCDHLGLKLLPKMMAGFIPIEVDDKVTVEPTSGPGKTPELWDAVLVDDDPIVHLAWKTSEQRFGKRTRKFTDVSVFLSALPEIDKQTPICIDQNLGNEVKGTQILEIVWKAGFQTIYLATGEDVESVEDVPGLTAIISKDPPWLRQSSTSDKAQPSKQVSPGVEA